MKSIILALCMVLAAGFVRAGVSPVKKAPAAKAAYRIYTEKSDKNVDYSRVNDFYSIYYVYLYVIQALGIDNRVPDSDVRNIIFTIVDTLKAKKVVQLQVDGLSGPEALRVTLRPDVAKGKPIVWLVSNYNAETKRTVRGDELKDAYATFFEITGSKLVKYQYAQPQKEEDLRKRSVNDLADYYLLDPDPKNDQTGRRMLVDAIAKSKDSTETAIMNMTLSEYHLLSGNTAGAKECLDKAARAVASLKDEKRRQALSRVLQYSYDVVDFYSKYEEKQQ